MVKKGRQICPPPARYSGNDQREFFFPVWCSLTQGTISVSRYCLPFCQLYNSLPGGFCFARSSWHYDALLLVCSSHFLFSLSPKITREAPLTWTLTQSRLNIINSSYNYHIMTSPGCSCSILKMSTLQFCLSFDLDIV